MSDFEPADENRRRLRPEERAALLARPLVGAFSSMRPRRWIAWADWD